MYRFEGVECQTKTETLEALNEYLESGLGQFPIPDHPARMFATHGDPIWLNRELESRGLDFRVTLEDSAS